MPFYSLESNLVTFLAASLKWSVYTLACNYTEPGANRSRGSNNSNTCFSN